MQMIAYLTYLTLTILRLHVVRLVEQGGALRNPGDKSVCASTFPVKILCQAEYSVSCLP